MIKVLPIKKVEDIERIKDKYREKKLYYDLFFLQWYFNQNTAEQALNFIDIHELMSAGFREGLNF